MTNDQVSDLLTRVRNAGMARLTRVDVNPTKLVKGVADILVQNGYLKALKDVVVEGRPMLRIYLKYEDGNLQKPVIQNLKRESRPGLRVYIGKDEIPRVLSGFGLSVISTSKGILSGSDAKKQGIGGELLCTVW